MAGRWIALLAAAITILSGVLLMIVTIVRDVRMNSGIFVPMLLATAFITVGLLALAGAYRLSPGLTLAAGIGLVSLCLVSIFLFPLLIPAIVHISVGAAGLSSSPQAKSTAMRGP